MLAKLRSFKSRFRYSESEMPFLEHLEEFRRTAIRCLISLVFGMLLCLPFADRLIALLRAPAEPYIVKNAEEILNKAKLKLRFEDEALSDDAVLMKNRGDSSYEVKAEIIPADTSTVSAGRIRLQFSEPAAAVKMWLAVTFFGGIFISLPLLIFYLGLFVMPGVRGVERRIMVHIALFSGGLFLLGIAMGYFVTLPLALKIMLKIGARLGGESIWFYNKYISFSLQLLLGFGLSFQFPAAILILGRMEMLNARLLREKRRHVIVALLILSMILTPPDVMTQLLMAAPLILLYECCIWVLYFSEKKRSDGENPSV